MPVSFLSREDDDCRFCGLRMIDFNSPSARWSDRAAGLKVKSPRKDLSTGHTLTELELPGGAKAKRPLKINLLVTDAPNGQMRIGRIDEITTDGKLVTSTTFDDFSATPLGQFPRTIVLEGFDEESNLLVRMVYTVKAFDLDQAIDNKVFAIGFEEAEKP